MLVLDTSVLVFASGADHPLREPAVRLLRDVVASRLSATTTPEVLQEYAHVRARRPDRVTAFAQAERFAELLGALTVVNTRAFSKACVSGRRLRLWGPSTRSSRLSRSPMVGKSSHQTKASIRLAGCAGLT